MDYGYTSLDCERKGRCCDLTFRAFCTLILNLEHLYIIEALTHAKATSMFKRLQMFTLIVMTPLQFELSQSSSNSWHVRQTCQLALTLVTTERSAKLTKTMHALICCQSRHKNTHWITCVNSHILICPHL